MSKARAKPSRGEGALQKASRDVVDAQFRSGMGHQPPPGERREPPVSRAVRTDNRFDGVERSWGGRGGGAEKGREACGRRCSISHAALLRVSISPHPLPSQVALSDCRIPHLHSFDHALSRFSFFFRFKWRRSWETSRWQLYHAFVLPFPSRASTTSFFLFKFSRSLETMWRALHSS